MSNLSPDHNSHIVLIFSVDFLFLTASLSTILQIIIVLIRTNCTNCCFYSLSSHSKGKSPQSSHISTAQQSFLQIWESSSFLGLGPRPKLLLADLFFLLQTHIFSCCWAAPREPCTPVSFCKCLANLHAPLWLVTELTVIVSPEGMREAHWYYYELLDFSAAFTMSTAKTFIYAFFSPNVILCARRECNTWYDYASLEILAPLQWQEGKLIGLKFSVW